MKNTSQLFDKLAIGWAILCAIHCAVLPIALVMFPSLMAISVEDHTFHNLMLWLVIPSSGIAVFLGCWQHKDQRVLLLASIGISLLILTACLGHETVGESGERVMTLMAATVLCMAHWRNFKLCHHTDCQHEHH